MVIPNSGFGDGIRVLQLHPAAFFSYTFVVDIQTRPLAFPEALLS